MVSFFLSSVLFHYMRFWHPRVGPCPCLVKAGLALEQPFPVPLPLPLPLPFPFPLFLPLPIPLPPALPSDGVLRLCRGLRRLSKISFINCIGAACGLPGQKGLFLGRA